MKKFAVLILTLCLVTVLAACTTSSKPVAAATIGDLTSANSREALFAAHQSFSTTFRAEYGQSSNGYATMSLVFVEFPDEQVCILTTGNEEWYSISAYADIGKPAVLHWYAMSDTERQTLKFDAGPFRDLLDQKTTPKEKIIEQKDNGDGTLSVTAQADTEAWFLHADEDIYPEEFRSADCVKCVYHADGETLELLSTQSYFVTGEKETLIGTVEVAYDAPQPERLTEMLAVIEKAHTASEAETCRLTVVYDAGTPEAAEYSAALVRGEPVIVEPRTGYALFYDPEGTVPCTGMIGAEDVTIYGLKQAAEHEMN